MYMIDEAKRTCFKRVLTDSFHPMEIPKDATLLGQVVLGSSSAPGEGLLVNSWTGVHTGGGQRLRDVYLFTILYSISLYSSMSPICKALWVLMKGSITIWFIILSLHYFTLFILLIANSVLYFLWAQNVPCVIHILSCHVSTCLLVAAGGWITPM